MGENTLQILKERYEKIEAMTAMEFSERLVELVRFIEELSEDEFRDLFEILFDKYWRPLLRK